jgi:hypothetical protein
MRPFVATLVAVKTPGRDTLARVHVRARVGQSVTHVASGSAMAVNVRFAFFFVRIVCLACFLLRIARAG